MSICSLQKLWAKRAKWSERVKATSMSICTLLCCHSGLVLMCGFSCIYLIDPDSIMTPSARRARSRLAAAAFPAQPLSPSDLPEPSEYESGSDDDEENEIISQKEDSDDDYGEPEPLQSASARTPLTPISPDDRTPRNSIDPHTQVTGTSPASQSRRKTVPKATTTTSNRLGMSPAEIRVIARLSKRVNVLPVVARADTLTDGRLERIKRAVRRDLQSVGREDDHGTAGVFAVWDTDVRSQVGRRSSQKENAGSGDVPSADDDFEHDDERQSRPVIKLRGMARGLTRSRSRKSLKTAVGAEYDEPDVEVSPGYPMSPPSTGHGQDHVSLASPSRRTSMGSARGADAGTSSYGAMFSRAELRSRMPFAIIAPERERDVKKTGGSQNGHAHGVPAPGVSGRFVRRFRWGTVDVLDPQHCDFAALRAAVLGSYMRVRVIVVCGDWIFLMKLCVGSRSRRRQRTCCMNVSARRNCLPGVRLLTLVILTGSACCRVFNHSIRHCLISYAPPLGQIWGCKEPYQKSEPTKRQYPLPFFDFMHILDSFPPSLACQLTHPFGTPFTPSQSFNHLTGRSITLSQ